MFDSFLNKVAAANAASEMIRRGPSVVEQLLQAKAESDRKNWPAKHSILRKLLEKNPEQFTQDSEQGSIVGLTHTTSGFKIHAPRVLLPRQLPGAK